MGPEEELLRHLECFTFVAHGRTVTHAPADHAETLPAEVAEPRDLR